MPPARHCAILAGGESRRMGTQKATVELAGKALALHLVEAAIAAGLEPVLVAKPDSSLPATDARVIREPREPIHPLSGVVAALERLGQPIVVCPCDVPELPAALLAELAERPEPLVVVREAERSHPLIGRYAPGLLAGLVAARDEGRSVTAAVDSLAPSYLEGPALECFGDPGGFLANVNTPEDLTEVQRRLRA
jgi:molybdenum cofactor guanylyltransferase